MATRAKTRERGQTAMRRQEDAGQAVCEGISAERLMALIPPKAGELGGGFRGFRKGLAFQAFCFQGDRGACLLGLSPRQFRFPELYSAGVPCGFGS